jgi:hypothetical protein
MSQLNPPFIPAFGSGAPGAHVPKNQPYYDRATNPYTPYIWNGSSWVQYGVSGGAGNATEIQGVPIDPTPPLDGETLVYLSAGNIWSPQVVAPVRPQIIQRTGLAGTLGPVTFTNSPTAGNLLIAILSEPTGNDNINGVGWNALLVDNLSFGYGWKLAGVGESATQTPTLDTSAGTLGVWEIQSGCPGPWFRLENGGTVKNLSYTAFTGSQLIIGICSSSSSTNLPTLSGDAGNALNFTGTSKALCMWDDAPSSAGAKTATFTFGASTTTAILGVPIS